MAWWSERVVPRLTHASLDNSVVAGYRRRLCADLFGDVLEVGFGTGLNLPHLPAAVRSLTAVEPSELSWELSAPARAACPLPVTRGDLRAERITLPDVSVDAVLVAFSLCTIAEPQRALAEMHRVLRPGGQLHFLEHGLAPGDRVQRWQHRLEPLQRRVAGGCHLTRSAPELVESAGFRLGALESWFVPGPGVSKPWGFVTLGRAERVTE